MSLTSLALILSIPLCSVLVALWTLYCIRKGYVMGRQSVGLATPAEDKPVKQAQGVDTGYEDPWDEAQALPGRAVSTVEG